MITSFAARPARWFGILSLPALLVGLLALVLAHGSRIGGLLEQWLVLAAVGMLLIFLGVHLISLGFLGELFVTTGDFSPRRNLRPDAEQIEAS